MHVNTFIIISIIGCLLFVLFICLGIYRSKQTKRTDAKEFCKQWVYKQNGELIGISQFHNPLLTTYFYETRWKDKQGKEHIMTYRDYLIFQRIKEVD